jgi:tRNA-2-methylthio-N6-dimethylallyladenosine synthase
MSDCLLSAGHTVSDAMEDANILIFNTCSIREKADEKLFSDLGRARLLQQRVRDLGDICMIIVAGCVAQAKSGNILRRAPCVDAIIGPQDIHRIASVVENISENFRRQTTAPIVITTLNAKSKFHYLGEDFFSRGCSEFLTIQEGCNNFCTYCVVPYTRGRETSRDVDEILKESKKLVALGVREIILLGQNVNSYNGVGPEGKNYDLSMLLFKLAEIDGLKRLRYITSNPKDVNKNIAIAHKEIDILMPFLHLPVQSGSDSILQKMNRKYSVDEYLARTDMLRDHRPDMAFSSDFIVGFPSETDSDFEKTLKLAEKMKFVQAYSFKFSPRENTAAAKMPDQVAESVKSERLQILQSLLNDHQSQFNRNSLGKRLSVLFTKRGKSENQVVGRSEYSQVVSVCDNCIKTGDIVNVRITQAKPRSLMGLVE